MPHPEDSLGLVPSIETGNKRRRDPASAHPLTSASSSRMMPEMSTLPRRNIVRDKFERFPKLPVAKPLFIIYVDGYNFYGAINHPEPDWLYGLGWCDFHKLGQKLVSESFLVPEGGYRLRSKYFTSLVPEDIFRAEARRQQLWLAALKPKLTDPPILGYWRILKNDDKDDGGISRREKRTDVNIAVHITNDVALLRPAGIIVISGDGDFEPVVHYAAKGGVSVAVFSPIDYGVYPPRPNREYTNLVHTGYLTRDVLEQCQLPKEKEWAAHFKLKARDRPDFQKSYEYALKHK